MKIHSGEEIQKPIMKDIAINSSIRIQRFLRLILCVSLMATLAACVSRTGPQFVYVANRFSSDVSAYRINTDGGLTELASSPFAVANKEAAKQYDRIPNPSQGFTPVSVAAAPGGRFIYAANYSSNNVSAYRINDDGALTHIVGSPFPAGYVPNFVAASPNGKFVYVAHHTYAERRFGGAVSAYRVNDKGALIEVVGSPFARVNMPDGPSATSIAITPNGKFVYVTNEDKISHNISAYAVNPDGVLKVVSGSPFPTDRGPRFITIDPAGKFAYVANNNGRIYVYSVHINGALTEIVDSPITSGLLPQSMAITPDGKFAYVANNRNVMAYTINADGTLTKVAGSPFATRKSPDTGGVDIRQQPCSVVIDSSGKFVYVVNCFQISTFETDTYDGVWAYRINADGSLTEVAGSPIAAGRGPVSITTTRRSR
jgi:6-phosphogluconolactonase (cycloisomerase 2 family)